MSRKKGSKDREIQVIQTRFCRHCGRAYTFKAARQKAHWSDMVCTPCFIQIANDRYPHATADEVSVVCYDEFYHTTHYRVF